MQRGRNTACDSPKGTSPGNTRREGSACQPGGGSFWTGLGLCIAGTVLLYLLTMKILAWCKVQI